MHNVKVKGILSNQNGMNLYRGCTHGCIYCDSRSLCYQFDHAFEDVAIKENALELLEDQLKRKRIKGMIAMGSMTDPYMPLERSIQSTHHALELIEKYGFGVSLITKSEDVVRDMDILKRIHEKTKAVVQITLTTYDDELCKRIEPNVSVSSKRFEALLKFKEAGIPTIVWMTPILPFINDTLENIQGILNYCIQAQVKAVMCFEMGLTLREGNREYFYEQLDEYFPGLKTQYIERYGTAYNCVSPQASVLMDYFKKTCKEHNILSNPDEIFEYLKTFETKKQLSLFD